MVDENKYPFNKITKYIIDGYGIDETSVYSIETVPAKQLLNWQRIDLMAKIMLIEAEEKGMDVNPYKELYLNHISAFSDGTFCEPGNEEKNSIEKYLSDFKKIIYSIKNEGFDEEISLIPIGLQQLHIIIGK